MKKFILFFSIMALVMVSCGGDDDDDVIFQDEFIGTWTWSQRFYNGIEDSLSDCVKQNKIVVNSDGTLTSSIYFDSNGQCEFAGEESAIWENKGNNVYKVIFFAGTSQEEIEESKIIFVDNTFVQETMDGTNVNKVIYIRN